MIAHLTSNRIHFENTDRSPVHQMADGLSCPPYNRWLKQCANPLHPSLWRVSAEALKLPSGQPTMKSSSLKSLFAALTKVTGMKDD